MAVKTIPKSTILLVAILLAVSSFPLAFFSGLFWDDWTMVWLYQNQGLMSLYALALQHAHVLYGPVASLPLFVDPEWSARLALVLSLICRISIALILVGIINFDGSRPFLAVAFAVFFLLTPLFDSRGILVVWHYDVFALAYIGSIWLSGVRGFAPKAVSVVLCLIGLSVEPLAALEPLRWWYLYNRSQSLPEAVSRSLPCFIAVIAYAISKLTFYVPFGVYEGYNSVMFEPSSVIDNVVANLIYVKYVALQSLYAIRDFRYDSIWIIIIVIVTSFGVFLPLLKSRRSDLSVSTGLALAGLAVMLLGSIAVSAIGQVASVDHFSNRFAVALQFGGALSLAAVVATLPSSVLRYSAASAAVFAFCVLNYQNAKWALLDSAVIADFRQDIAVHLKDREPEVIWVEFEWNNSGDFYRRRCLSANDMNVKLRMMIETESFLYDLGCTKITETGVGNAWCMVSGRDRGPCPTRKEWLTFVIPENIDRHYEISLPVLINAVRRENTNWGDLQY